VVGSVDWDGDLMVWISGETELATLRHADGSMISI
jgi:hypothetical protein